MNAKVKIGLFILLGIMFGAISTGVFFLPSLTFPFLALQVSLIIIVLTLESLPLAIIFSVCLTLVSVFALKQIGQHLMWVILVNLIVTFGFILFFYFREKSLGHKTKRLRVDRDDLIEQSKVFEKEISFYEEKHQKLVHRRQQRQQLAQAARELGGLLDPQAIQEKLIETARIIFHNEPVRISLGEGGDSVDNYIIQKRQSILLQDGAHKDTPFMAAPIEFQRTVAGILRVGGASRPPYSKEEFRLLEILASLASMALGNSFLFNQVKENALRDGLTGLLTHRAFNEHLDSHILEASRYNQVVSLILADLDHFKSINDTYGHQVGDQMLQGFSHVMVRNVRDVDVVARYGGEEFILLLLQKNHSEACHTAEQIRQDLAGQRFEIKTKDGQIMDLGVTGSFGVASFPKDATSAQQLVRMADQRLYEAKRGGRNRVVG